MDGKDRPLRFIIDGFHRMTRFPGDESQVWLRWQKELLGIKDV